MDKKKNDEQWRAKKGKEKKEKKNRKKEKNQGKSNKLIILILLAYVTHHNCTFIKLRLTLLPIMVETKEEAVPSDDHGAESSGDKKTFSGGKALKKKNTSGHVDKKMKERPSY